MQVPDVCGDQIELGIDILMHKCRSPSSIVKGKRASVEDKHWHHLHQRFFYKCILHFKEDNNEISRLDDGSPLCK